MAKEKKDALNEVSDEKETKKQKKAKSDKNTKKSEKSEKKSGGFAKWFKDLKTEFKLVTWPTKQTVMVNSGIVLGTIVIASIFVGLLDTGLLELMKFLLDLGHPPA